MEIDSLAGVMVSHVIHRTAPIELANVRLLRGDATLRRGVVLVGIKRNLQYLGMSHRQQLANFGFHFPVMALTEDLHDDGALRIDQITIRPALGTVCLPSSALLIGHHRPRQAIALRRRAHIVDLEADVEFAEVYSDDVKAVGMVLGVPALDHAEVANTVDAGVLPEIDKHDMTAVVGDMVRNWGTLIEPHVARSEVGRGTRLRVHLG